MITTDYIQPLEDQKSTPTLSYNCYAHNINNFLNSIIKNPVQSKITISYNTTDNEVQPFLFLNSFGKPKFYSLAHSFLDDQVTANSSHLS
jgi:hypothetical protein